MKITCVGTDPAGLYLAALIKARSPGRQVTIIDTGAPERTAAPPHILTNPVKPQLELADAEVAGLIAAATRRTRGIVIRRDGEAVRAPGHAYSMIGAAALATILRERAASLGCTIVRGAATGQAAEAGNILVIAEGADSPLRARLADGFRPQLRPSATRFLVLEADRAVTEPAFVFRRTAGGVLHAFVYPDGQTTSTVVVEATALTLATAGLESASAEHSASMCAELLGSDLGGATLRPRSAGWRPFMSVRNATWTSGTAVLLGAAAYNAHFSIGLGVRSGLEDAEALASLLDSTGTAEAALERFEAARRPRAESLLRASAASLAWFESTGRYIGMPAAQFAYSCLTRSLRLNHESMRALAPELTNSVEEMIAREAAPAGGASPAGSASLGQAGAAGNKPPPPPMFTPITLRGITIPNRIVMSPMCMYNATDGAVGDFHLVHYGSRAVGGAGLILTEMTDVSPEGRISAHCAGLYKHEHVAAWRRVTDFVHARSNARIGVQLGHSGRKGAEPRPWERSSARGGPAWQTIAPSPVPFQPGGPAPREMDRADMDRLVAAYANAARLADEAGFDMIELHLAHGYLLSTFISPLSNQRTDRYGGPLANRLRFPMEVFEAVRAAWPHDKPISVRISATDWVEGGTSIEDAITIGRTLKDAGNDILTVSAGGVTGVRPGPGRLYQATLSDQIRNELKIRTMNVGGMASHGDINAMIAAGRADMCALGRGHLFDPYFARHAAYQLGHTDLAWPSEYERAGSIDMHDF